MTQRIEALKGNITEEMKWVAQYENVSEEYIMKKIASGSICLPHNKNRKKKYYYAIGEGISTKINANIGTSPYHIDIDEEIEKMNAAINAGAHSIMDLSLGNKIKIIRKKILELSPVMVGTVPIYEMGFDLSIAKKDIVDIPKINGLKVKIIDSNNNRSKNIFIIVK